MEARSPNYWTAREVPRCLRALVFQRTYASLPQTGHLTDCFSSRTEVLHCFVNVGYIWQWTLQPIFENNDSSYHLLSAFYMPGTVLGTLYPFIMFNPHNCGIGITIPIY